MRAVDVSNVDERGQAQGGLSIPAAWLWHIVTVEVPVVLLVQPPVLLDVCRSALDGVPTARIAEEAPSHLTR